MRRRSCAPSTLELTVPAGCSTDDVSASSCARHRRTSVSTLSAAASGMASGSDDAAVTTKATYHSVVENGARAEAGLRRAADKAGVPLTVNRVGSMLTAFFTPGPVTDYASARRSDTARYARFFHAMLDRGVYLAPSQFEAAFLSLAHTEADLDHVARAAEEALAAAA